VTTTEDSQAGVVSRTLAALIDAGVLFVLLGAGYLGLVGVTFAADPLGFRFPTPPRAVTGSVAVVVLVGYLAESWTTSGRSYGARVLGLRVVDRHGHPPRLGRALARAFLCALFPVGLLWVAVSARRRSVQDLLLGTSVVYDWGTPVRPRVDVVDQAT
jgi:uncharacterized RDD family membrane protein YckC